MDMANEGSTPSTTSPTEVVDANTSAVSWASIFAGAAAAAALSLILLILGFGLGMSSISPWANSGAKASTIGITTILWLTLTQILASGLGGYLSGRLRVKWASVHTDEVYFRDTAHGLLAWAVATIVTATFLASAVSTALGGAIDAGASAASTTATSLVAGSAAAAGNSSGQGSNVGSNTIAYFVDSLFRGDKPAPDTNYASAKAEATRIFINDLFAKDLPIADRQYLGSLVATRTGLSQPDAEARVSDIFFRTSKTLNDAETAVRQTADQARKAAAYSALWMFVALLCGAFFASLAAVFGGRQRDFGGHVHAYRK